MKRWWGLSRAKSVVQALVVFCAILLIAVFRAPAGFESQTAKSNGKDRSVLGLDKATGRVKESRIAAGNSAGEAKSALPEKRKPTAYKKKVLAVGAIHGRAAIGYAAARACPETIDKLFCYCGCDLSASHQTLLDCFTSDHGAYCDDCQEEAILGHKLQKKGVAIGDIQKAVDKTFSKHYPFVNRTKRYQKYLDSRLYLADSGPESAKLKPGMKVVGAGTSDGVTVLFKPKLRTGKSIGRCCANGQHSKMK